MKNIVFVTGHFAQQKRKTSMRWVTDYLQTDGWHVTYATVGYSWLSKIWGDHRLTALDAAPNTGTTAISPTLTSIFGYSPVHPINLKNPTLNRIIAALNSFYTAYWARKLRASFKTADVVIIESGAPVALGAIIARLAPNATRIYRVSDDIRLLNAPKTLLDGERVHHHFHRISTGSPLIAARFADHPNVTLDPMGVPHGLVTKGTIDPYHRISKNADRPIAVCAGSTLLDMDQIEHIARSTPWDIHVIGRLKSTPPVLSNVTWHGELPFAKTLAYIQHADIGLAPFQDVAGVEYQITNSNRILLYRHTGLPILVPTRLACADIPCLIANTAPDWQARCEHYGKHPENIPDWSALAVSLVQNGVTDPPDVTSMVPATSSNARVNTVPPFTSSA